jgi:hypothetical protein
MNAFYSLVAVLFFVAGIPWCIYLVILDFSCREIWGQDVTHDPRVYLPLLTVALPLCGYVWWREVRKLRQMEEAERERNPRN